MSIQAEHVRQLIARSHAIRFGSLKAELSRAIACCRIAKKINDDANILRYLLVAEATSAKFMKLRSQGKIGKSKTILGLMSLLEDELGAGDQSQSLVTGSRRCGPRRRSTLTFRPVRDAKL